MCRHRAVVMSGVVGRISFSSSSHSQFRSASRLAVGPVYWQLGVIGIVKHGNALDKSRHVLLQIEMGRVVLEKVLAFAGGSESDGKGVRVLALELKSAFISARGSRGDGVVAPSSPRPGHCP